MIASDRIPEISGSLQIPDASTLLLGRATVTHASGTNLAVMVVSVSVRDACACDDRGDALMSATGFSYSSPLLTSQSSAFFRVPGTPCAYSGLEMRTPLLASNCERNSLTAGGGVSVSRSGLKCGSSDRLE